LGQILSCALTARPAWQFRLTEAREALQRQFRVTTLTGFGLGDDDAVIGPAGAVISYLLETQQAEGERLAHLSPPRRRSRTDYLLIDQVSLRSLEVERTMRSGEVAGSLLGVLQNCRTAMGKRMLRQWLCYPLTDLKAIEQRQDAVAAFAGDPALASDLNDALEQVQDVQRISGRIAVGRPTPRDLVALGRSVKDVPALLELLSERNAFARHRERLESVADPLAELGGMLTAACVDGPPGHLRDGGLIRDGYDAELDEYRTLQRDAGQFLSDYQKSLVEQTEIPSLKLGYNKVFGYYIEITHAHTGKVPPSFTRKQTLKNAERYITPELKTFEDKILSAGQKSVAREQTLFTQLCEAAAGELESLNVYAEMVAELDVLSCFAGRAVRYRYTRPAVVDKPVLLIKDGRHPVLDELLEDRFVPNDADLGDGETLALITGPNMAGKSTYIRQAALLTLLAHTGSFIPAAEATIGLTDRIFTRIGASDEIHLGQSTFMVEMTETANICHHATERSLVILDEIGRGTSTLDGLALAWAIAEHLAGKRCRTLFATHYHELTDLAEQFENVANLNVTVREWADEVVFLHRITRGSADKSYGIHVAQIAGLPEAVVTRAKDLMGRLEVHTGVNALASANGPPAASSDGQLGLFTE
ncbi:MAG: DNA mismatch repair protein MutS, partial [Phycisphaeraceae bacterium]